MKQQRHQPLKTLPVGIKPNDPKRYDLDQQVDHTADIPRKAAPLSKSLKREPQDAAIPLAMRWASLNERFHVWSQSCGSYSCPITYV